MLLHKIAEQFSQKEFPRACAKTFITVPDGNIPSSSWSLGNKILMMMSGTADARGYRQWEKVGRHVKKGSKAIYILVPMTKKIEDKKTGEERVAMIGFRGAPVFCYEDTEGQRLKTYEPRVLPPLFDLAKKNGIDVRYANSKNGEYGSIQLHTKKITLSTESHDTFLHELMHWYDGKKYKLKPKQDAEQEIVAQLGACVLAEMYGYDAREYTWNYVSSYAETKSPQEIGQRCFRVLGRVQQAVNAILYDADEWVKEAENPRLKENRPIEVEN